MKFKQGLLNDNHAASYFLETNKSKLKYKIYIMKERSSKVKYGLQNTFIITLYL
jgi:hypothetical protein